MLRKIINIDKEKCNGCGACAEACHEGAIQMINGVAELVRDDYCDGLGDCLPACPADAISFVMREAAAYDEAAVLRNKAEKEAAKVAAASGREDENPSACKSGGCPGERAAVIRHENTAGTPKSADCPSCLSTWPVQIRLAPVNAPYFDNANLLIAADCTAYAYGNFHQEFIRNRVTLVGCPKLDPVDYSEKLTAIIAQNNIKSVTITRMEVPCCGGLEFAAKKALQDSGKFIPWQVVTISADGRIL